jgi:hypothetical protein
LQTEWEIPLEDSSEVRLATQRESRGQ